MLKPILEEFKDKSNIKIVSVDISENENLASKYNVNSIPCLILFNNKKEIRRNVGLINMDELKEFVGDLDD
jgi:thioredoxin 1